jgi:riboflavin synthase
MFTGIINALGRVVRRTPDREGVELVISAPDTFARTRDGDSVAVNGVCLTAKHPGAELIFDVVPETLGRTDLGALEVGEEVNLEPSLRVGDEIGGHLVYGHVDGVCTIVRREPQGQGFRLWCEVPLALRNFIIEKGYVSLDGVSLTVAGVEADRFCVALIPETLKRTTLGRKGVGNLLNIEADPVARYVAALLRDRTEAKGSR